ncbi:hypothetical protein B0T16DRAFT_187386 [Cercophora newfieldiana]|uniref:SAP domain-containing protein n=1 Tax=Cercophora newfieldiana TaxID=92897 RepID=A0AA40CMB1_9PEZI|nr:hypothetical protein B0T16DRAFT_187386 [Cercophora newfieldiana]
MATDWSRLTVVDLRAELKRRGLAQAGKKADLVERLVLADGEAPNDEKPAEQPDDATAAEDTPKKELLERETSPPKETDSTQPIETPIDTAPTSEPPAGPPSTSANEAANADATPEPAAQPSVSAHDAEPVIEKVEENAPTEGAAIVPEVMQDASRKRRSRSPPPEDEISRKRARPSDGDEKNTNDNQDLDAMPLDIVSGKDVSYAIIQPNITTDRAEPDSRPMELDNRDDQRAKRDTSVASDRNGEYMRPVSQDRDTRLSHDSMPDEDRHVAPSEHPATSALYIKNFMRPLRENTLRDYLCELAAPRGSEPDPDAVEDFFLDQIRTHALVRFRSTSAASRVRVALHGQVWPNERERKELWVDFVPPEKVAEWANQEQTEGGRGTRWEVRYDFDHDGNATARLANVDSEPPRQPSRLQPPPVAPVSSIPTGPSRQYGGVEGAPLGPRGRGTAAYRQDSFPAAGGEWKQTRTRPSLPYKPVAQDLADRRLDNMRSYYTKDRNRDLGREDEINRYTFENQDGFVDRGKENFVGIRPPHREREVQQRRAQERRNGPSYVPPPPRGGDRYYGSGRESSSRFDEPSRDEPRSRLNGAPMPTFDAYRGGGGGGRGGGRRGWRR